MNSSRQGLTPQPPSAGPTAPNDAKGNISAAIRWWPALAGLAFGLFVARDLFDGTESGADLGAIVAASGLVYLGAAALHRRWTAWPVFFLSVLVIAAAKTARIGAGATWILLGLAGLFFAWGLLHDVRRSSFSAQAIGMAVFGTLAATVLVLDHVTGAYLVAAGLLLHAAWDAYHFRANRAVIRSMSEFCFVLDIALAAAIVITTSGD
ncbi:hypothetical protein [Sphingosinicella sp. CPCC 101087]|uniref:hypothetical protein n=1 Tax=Sphingosinicella sp. CPCC 101087 TaxID=2497754 RepID=UPI001981F14D|nr:hypothetical protein [Sphingosinicella sp. CPCC 101087]